MSLWWRRWRCQVWDEQVVSERDFWWSDDNSDEEDVSSSTRLSYSVWYRDYDTQHFDFGWVEAAVLTVNICSFGRILLLVDFLLDFLCINLLSHSSLLHRQGFLTTVLPLLSFCREETSSGMISSFLIQEVFLQMIIMIIRNNFPSIFKSPTTTCYVTIV